jgi:hypothetical protein
VRRPDMARPSPPSARRAGGQGGRGQGVARSRAGSTAAWRRRRSPPPPRSRT